MASVEGFTLFFLKNRNTANKYPLKKAMVRDPIAAVFSSSSTNGIYVMECCNWRLKVAKEICPKMDEKWVQFLWPDLWLTHFFESEKSLTSPTKLYALNTTRVALRVAAPFRNRGYATFPGVKIAAIVLLPLTYFSWLPKPLPWGSDQLIFALIWEIECWQITSAYFMLFECFQQFS